MNLQTQFLKSVCVKGALTLGLLIMLFPAFCQQNPDLERQESFIKLLDKEVQNRAFCPIEHERYF